jgi:predicted ArsR family transcriptional regulator
MRAIDDMAKEAEELAQRVDTETAEALKHIQELASRTLCSSRAEAGRIPFDRDEVYRRLPHSLARPFPSWRLPV